MPAADRITEVGIVRVDADAAGGAPRVHEWSTLVDPEVPIPPAIQALTGITDAMVARRTDVLGASPATSTSASPTACSSRTTRASTTAS